MAEIAFRTVQAILWMLVIAGWVRSLRSPSDFKPVRQWFSQGSLACASLSLLLTTAMTIYARVGQQKPYDSWESQYLLYTTVLSVLGVALAVLGKSAPRLIGLSTSVFTLLVALADAVSL